MSIATRPLTYEDLLQTPEDGKRYEIIGGELIVTASPAKRHNWVSFQLARRLLDHVERLGLGQVYHALGDVQLTEHDVVVPDIFFLSGERKRLYGEQKVDGAPDLIVEVLSPSTRSRDLTAKMDLYARTGVREYWIVDPETARVDVYSRSAHGAFELLSPRDGRVRSRVLPEFDLDPRELLAGFE